jgi:hypothetical protein
MVGSGAQTPELSSSKGTNLNIDLDKFYYEPAFDSSGAQITGQVTCSVTGSPNKQPNMQGPVHCWKAPLPLPHQKIVRVSTNSETLIADTDMLAACPHFSAWTDNKYCRGPYEYFNPRKLCTGCKNFASGSVAPVAVWIASEGNNFTPTTTGTVHFGKGSYWISMVVYPEMVGRTYSCSVDTFFGIDPFAVYGVSFLSQSVSKYCMFTAD